jgi:DNA-binding GntR family transcriptional regulator
MTRPFRKLEAGTLADQIAARVEEAIMSGTVLPGEHLSASVLAREFNVSHIPVREALKQLEASGLIVQEANKRARVVVLSQEDIQNIFVVRRILEGEAAARACSHFNENVQRNLETYVETMQRAAEVEDFHRLLACDKGFHETIWQCAGNPFLTKALSNLLFPYFGFLAGRGYYLHRENLKIVTEIHQITLDGLASGDPEKARAAMTGVHTRSENLLLKHSMDSVTTQGESRKPTGLQPFSVEKS